MLSEIITVKERDNLNKSRRHNDCCCMSCGACCCDNDDNEDHPSTSSLNSSDTAEERETTIRPLRDSEPRSFVIHSLSRKFKPRDNFNKWRLKKILVEYQEPEECNMCVEAIRRAISNPSE